MVLSVANIDKDLDIVAEILSQRLQPTLKAISPAYRRTQNLTTSFGSGDHWSVIKMFTPSVDEFTEECQWLARNDS